MPLTACSKAETLKRKLRYQCQYRGTCELDLLLRRFVAEDRDEHILNWSLFEQFLSEPEPLLADWLINQMEVPDAYQDFVDLINRI